MELLINVKQTEALRRSIHQARETFCNGLFLSARWFVVSAAAHEGINLIVLPNREAAEYCAADLYHLTEGDCVFYLPDSGKNLEKSNFKASLGGFHQFRYVLRLMDTADPETVFAAARADNAGVLCFPSFDVPLEQQGSPEQPS